MKRFPEFNPRRALPRLPTPSTLSELDGFVGAGMKKEALQLARQLLKAPRITAPTFAQALNTILTLSDTVKPWRALVETAYERVPKQSRGAVRFWIMSIRNACHDHEGVLRLVPKRFGGEFALLELLYAMDATFATGDKNMMRKLARRLPRPIDRATNPETQAMLWLCVAEVCMREGEWDDIVPLMEPVHESLGFIENAVDTVVEVHVVGALKALQRGFQKIAAFRKGFDPETELMLPGNDKAILDHAAKDFRRLQKVLERIVPKERQKELGFA